MTTAYSLTCSAAKGLTRGIWDCYTLPKLVSNDTPTLNSPPSTLEKKVETLAEVVGLLAIPAAVTLSFAKYMTGEEHNGVYLSLLVGSLTTSNVLVGAKVYFDRLTSRREH